MNRRASGPAAAWMMLALHKQVCLDLVERGKNVTFPPKNTQPCNIKWHWESIVGSVIQATWTVDIEDGLWKGNHLKAQNGLQVVYNTPGVQPGAVRKLRFLQGQTKFQSG